MSRRTPWRGALMLIPAVSYGFLFAGGMLVTAIGAPRFARRHVHSLGRAWGGFILTLYGVRLQFRNRERLDEPGTKVVLYNHESTLDLFVLAALLPPNSLVLYKSEFHRIPLIGWAIRALGMAPVQLDDRRRSLRDLLHAGRRAREEGRALLVSPEGGRSSAGELQPFKRGAFYLAARDKMPIMPMVLHGAHDLLPRDSILVRSGTILVECLPLIDTTGWDERQASAHAEETRELFRRHLKSP